MDQFENDLREALRPVPPPMGFEQRVLARLARESALGSKRPQQQQQRRYTAWAAAAGLAIASVAGFSAYQEQRQQHRAEEAHEQLVLALRVTSQKLDLVRSRINTSSTSETR